MKLMQGLVLAFCTGLATSAYPASKEEIIKDAVKNGASIVVCDNGLCMDSQTHEVVGRGENGTFLLYPPGHEAEEEQTARMLARAD